MNSDVGQNQIAQSEFSGEPAEIISNSIISLRQDPPEAFATSASKEAESDASSKTAKTRQPRKSKSASERTKRLEFPESNYEAVKKDLKKLAASTVPMSMQDYLFALHQQYGNDYATRITRVYAEAFAPHKAQ